MSRKLTLVAAVLSLAAVSSPSHAMPMQPSMGVDSLIVTVADGCGGGRYRGPYGSCHRFGTGPYPAGYFGPYRGGPRANGCPPGYWRGPWGHCRDTPYHGRLPGGGWK